MKRLNKYRWELLFLGLFCLSRAPYIGQEMFNTDVWKWKARIYDFGSGVFNLEFDKTLQKYHPGVTLMWIGTAAVKFQGLYCAAISCPNETTDFVGAVFTLHFFQKVFMVLALAVILTFVFYPLRQMFGKRYAFITLSLLIFEPFFYALTRVIHLEGLLTSFMLASFVWLFYGLEISKEKNQPLKLYTLVFSSIFGGLAMLTKSSAIFIIPFAVISILIYQKKSPIKVIKYCLAWLLIMVATYSILWPSMWVQPAKTLDYVFVRGIKETGFEDEHAQIFLGQYTQNPGPIYYLVVVGYKFSPLLVTGIILFGLFYGKILPHFGNERAKGFALLSAMFAVGYLLELTIPTKKLDRYILPSLASISLLGGFFYTWLIFTVLGRFGRDKFLRHSRNWGAKLGPQSEKVVKIVASSFFLTIVGYQSLSLTPDYFSYYSPLLGGLSKGIYALEPKWIIGQHEVAKYFSDVMKKENLDTFSQGQSFDNQKDLSAKLTVAFPEKYYTQIWPFIRRIGGWATIEDLRDNAKKSRYFVYPVWDDYSYREKRFKLEYKDSIYLKGVKLYNVYQNTDVTF